MDKDDLIQLKDLLYKSEEVSFVDLKKEYSGELKKISEQYKIENPLGLFLRSLIGLEQEALNREFSNFLDKERFNGNQIELIEMVIKNFVRNGSYDKNELPKISKRIMGISLVDLFPKREDLIKISSIIDKINNNTEIPNIKL